MEKALTALKGYRVGKPLVVEEMFPLECSVAELDQFVDGSRPVADGWVGFYWGKTREEYARDEHTRDGMSPVNMLLVGWLDYFRGKAPSITGPAPAAPKRG